MVLTQFTKISIGAGLHVLYVSRLRNIMCDIILRLLMESCMNIYGNRLQEKKCHMGQGH